MKTNFNLLAAGIFLASVGTGFGQSLLQFSTSISGGAENAGPATLTVRRGSDINPARSEDSRFQGEAGNAISFRLAPQVRTDGGDKPTVIYSLELERRAVKPINMVRSKKYPGLEYSGSLVQAAQSNPLQLINPFAPARYGDGEANTVRNLVTKEAEGLKLWQISL